MSREDRGSRLRLAGRILMRRMGKGQPPVTLEEVAQLRFLAESDEEREMPIEKLAAAILERESRRRGYPPPGSESASERRN